jgi:uncharacterized repeat protein (TIGR01451 family)
MRLRTGLLLIIIVAICPAAWSQPVALVEDIAPQASSPLGPGPSELALVGSALFFGGVDPANGLELWTSDGTPAGTKLVRDIAPGRLSSVPRWLTAVGGTLYFVAFDGEHGDGLWKSDGSAAGTVLVKGAGADFSSPQQLAAVGGRLFLAAFDHSHGLELWTSNGTTAGTLRVKDIFPGTGSSLSVLGFAEPYLTAVGGTLYFAADDGTRGRELWRSNGTAAGTTRVKDIRPGSAGSAPSELLALGGSLFFYADDGASGRELWKSDGTGPGTVLLADTCLGTCGVNDNGLQGRAPGNIAAVGSTLFFKAGPEPALWKTDGTPGGTAFVEDVGFQGSVTDPHLTAAGGLLFLIGAGASSAAALWSSDGTGPGTSPLADVGPSNRLAGVGAQLFLISEDFAGRTLWTSDGTVGGTAAVQLYQYSGSALHSSPLGGALLFVADDGVAGSALWRSDGTAPGTSLVADPHPGLCPDPAGELVVPCGSSSPAGTIDVAGTLFFATAEQELWKSDGTAPGTVVLADLSGDCGPQLPCDGPTGLTPVGARLFFNLSRIGPTNGLWTSDGTPGGTSHLADTGFLGLPGDAAPLGGNTIYVSSGAGAGVWKSDGTPGGTVPVLGFPSVPFPPIVNNPQFLTPAPGLVFMAAWQPSLGFELWKTDGTAAGTVLVKDINPGPAGSGPSDLFPVGSVVFFSADDGVAGRELWRSDGTAAGTVRVKDILPGAGSSFPHGLSASGGLLYFTARDATNGYELWRSDGSAAGTIAVNIRPGGASSHPEQLTSLGSLSIFTANDGTTGREPWVSDGTPAGTHRVADLAAGPASGGAGVLVPTGSVVFFPANDAAHGRELWRTDGLAIDRVQDLAAAAGSSDPSEIAASGSRVFLAAEDGAVGRELWALDAAPGGLDLGLTKTAAPEPLSAGQPITFTFTVRNTGPSPATGVTLTDVLPQGTVFINAVPGPPVCTHASGVVTCNLGTVPPAVPIVVTVTAQVTLPTGLVVNTASVDGNELDPVLGNNTATSTTTVSPADLSVALLDSPDPTAPEGTVTFTIATTNNGPAPATGAVSTLVLPPGLSFVSAVPPLCTSALNVVTCPWGSVPPAATLTAQVTAGVGAGTSVTTDAAVNATEIDPALGNNVASATTGIAGLTANELVHGSAARADLAPVAGPDEDWYRIGQAPHSSYEVVVDAVSGDLGAGGPDLRRMAADGATALQDSIPVGALSSRSLVWENASDAPVLDELVQVASLGCTGCSASDAYRIRAYETTYAVPRFNNSASQITVMLLQNATARPVNGTAWFWSGAGALLASRAFGLEARAGLVLNLAGMDELVSQSGSITVTSDAPYGGLAGKGVAIEPDTGFTFDSPLLARAR